MQSSHIVNQEVNFDNSKESQANTNKHDRKPNLATSILFQNDQNLFVWRNASFWPPMLQETTMIAVYSKTNNDESRLHLCAI